MPSDRRASMVAEPVPGRPLVIELVGAPGAGKTTLATALVGLLREQGLEAASVIDAARGHAARTGIGRVIRRLAPRRLRRPLLWWLFYGLGLLHAVAFAREHRRLVRHVLSTQARRPLRPRLKAHILFWFFQLGGRTRFLATTARPGEVLVLDDGFLHRAVHLNADPRTDPDPRSVHLYVDLLPRPDLVVAVVAPPSVCDRRVRDRGVWRHSRHLTSAELSRYLAGARQVTDLVLDRARGGGATVVEIRNDEPLDRVLSTLRSTLPRLSGAADSHDDRRAFA